jgi:glycosyltransferase involved in cell wall biosynthesis
MAAPKVSVSVVTYNHEAYIAQAVEGVLMQDFVEWELVIGDDCSTDGTTRIVEEYAAAHPDSIRALETDHNLGMMTNFKRVYESCTGEYVALLDGDDYWTSPEKLRKQVEFLDANPDCAICFHNVLVTYEDGSGMEPYPFNDSSQKRVSTIEDLLRGNFMQTCSVMFRRDLFGPLPDWLFGLQLGDWPLHVLNAQYGWVGYIDEVMASYRVHGDGVWSTTDMAYRVRSAMQAFEALEQHLDPKYRPYIKTSLASAKFELWRLENIGGSKREARAAAREYVRAAMEQRPRDVRGIVRVLGHTYAPRLMPRMVKIYKALRRL